MKKYLFLGAAFEGGRTFAGATSAAYLVSIGQPLAVIAQLKMIQAIVMLCSDFPTGLFADYFGRRISLIVSAVLGAAAFAIYFLGRKFFAFAAAEVCLGLSLSFWSGAYDAYAVDQLKLAADKPRLNTFFHTASSVNSLAVIVSGFVGGLVANSSLARPYLLCVVALIGLVGFILFRCQRDPGIKTILSTASVLPSVRAAVGRSELRPYIIGLVVLMFMMQPIIYYWQPWFLELARVESSASVGSILGTVFIAFQGAIIVTSLIYARANRSGRLLADYPIPLAGLAFAGTIYLTVSTRSLWRSIAFFCACEALLTILSSLYKAKLNERIDSKLRASVLSAINVIAKTGTVVGLLTISTYLGGARSGLSELRSLFLIAAGLGIVFSFFALLIFWRCRGRLELAAVQG